MMLPAEEGDRNGVARLEGSRLKQTVRSFDVRLFVTYVVSSLAAIFYLPLLVPVVPAASVSYAFGYNNRVGVALVLILVTFGTLWTKGLNLELCTEGFSERLPKNTLLWSLLGVLAGCVAMYVFAGRFGGFGESTYFIDRAWLVSQGKIPYLDFEFAYGTFFVYGPILLNHLHSLGIARAYYLFWLFNFLLGTVLLFRVVNMIDYPSRSKLSIYKLLYASQFLCIFSMGTNYTSLRYACPLFFILIVHKFLKRGSVVYAALLSVAFTLVLFLISPEIAIAHGLACAGIFLLTRPPLSGRYLAAFSGMLFLFGVIFRAALKSHLLDTMKANGEGADSFPITFAPHLLLFFAAFFVCACYVYRRYSGQGIQDNTICLIVYSIPMAAAALGRCDPGHVLLNGEAVFLASMFYVSNNATVWRWYKRAFVVVMLILPLFSLIAINLQPIARVCITSPYRTVDLASFYPSWHGPFLAPFGYRPNGIGSYLSTQVDYGRYEGFASASSVEAIQGILAEIRDQPEKALLLPNHFETACPVNIATDRFVMSVLFAFPYYGRPVHLEGIRQPICDYILANYTLEYEPTRQNFGYGLWFRRSVEASP